MSGINGFLPLLMQLAASGAMSGAGGGAGGAPGAGSGGLGGLLGSFGGGGAGGAASLGPSGIPGSASLFGAGAGMGGGQLPGTPPVQGGMPSQFSMPAGVGPSSMSPMMLQGALAMMQQGTPQQQGQPAPMPQQVAFGNPAMRGQAIGQPMPYLSVSRPQPFGFGGVPYV